VRKFGDVIRFSYSGSQYVVAMILIDSELGDGHHRVISDEGTAFPNEEKGHLIFNLSNDNPGGLFHLPGETSTTYAIDTPIEDIS
jgi:hypothetical protein